MRKIARSSVDVHPGGSEAGFWVWGSPCSFLVARTLLSHLRADRYSHCPTPPTSLRLLKQEVSDELITGSLKHWNLPCLVIVRTVNNKSPRTWGLTFSHFWDLLFFIYKPKACMFTFTCLLDSRAFSPFLSPHVCG